MLDTTGTGIEDRKALARKAVEGELLTRERVRLVIVPDPFGGERFIFERPAGASIADLFAFAESEGRVPRRLSSISLAYLEGQPIPREHWHRVRPKPGTITIMRAIPEGGLRGILQIFIAIAAIAVQFIPGIGQIAGVALTLAIGIGGNLLLNALYPVRPPQLNVEQQEARRELYSFGGIRNQAELFGPIPSLLGTMRVYARLGAKPYTEIVGEDQFFRGLFVWAYGPIDLASLQIGETPLSNLDELEIEHNYGYESDNSHSLFPSQVFQQDLTIDLKESAGEWITLNTQPDTDEWAVDFVAPQGILYIAPNGSRQQLTLTIESRYRPVGGGAWTNLPNITWSGKTQNPLRRGLRWVPAEGRGQYELQGRLLAVPENLDDGSLTLWQVIFSALRSFRNDPPITFPKPLATTAIRVKMTGQLNGALDTLNAICTSRVRAFNGSSWDEDTPSNNPGDLGPWVLQGPANARPYSDDEIHWESWQEFWAFCELHNYRFNMWRSTRQSVMDTVADICAAARGSPAVIDGKQGVIFDQPDSPIVQHFTPRNSRNFRSRRHYRYWPHAWRVRFLNEDMGYNEDERIVFDDGFDENNATRYEGMEFPGVTSSDQNWKLGRFHIAQLRLRPEDYSLEADFEQLVCTRGDRVVAAYDVPLWGLASGRVAALSASLPQSVTLDEEVTQEAGKMYAIRFRLADGSGLTRAVTTQAGTSRTLQLTGSGDMPTVGDLGTFGESGLEVVALRVKAIDHLEEGAARITLVDDAPAISEADSGEIPAYESNITIPPDPLQLPPQSIQLREFVYLEEDGTPREAILASWQVPRFGVIQSFEVQARNVSLEGDFEPAAAVPAPQLWAEIRDLESASYQVRVRAIFADGRPSGWVESDPIALGALTTAPADVTGFMIAVLGENATLTWNAVSSPAPLRYRVKYSPLVVGATWGSATTLQSGLSSNALQVPAQAGSYLIKAVIQTTAGEIEGVNATIIAANISVLTQLNVHEELTENPDWLGDQEGIAYDSGLGGLALIDVSEASSGSGSGAEFLSEGYYYFSAPIDLGAIFTSRVTIQITAYGTNLFDDWFAPEDFFDPPDYFDLDPGDWQLIPEIALSNKAAADSDPEWSDWAEFQISDYTFRSIDGRIYFGSLRPGVTPVLTALTIHVDMPDRIEADNDLTIPAEGLRIDFLPPFLSLKGVSILAQDLASGERARTSYKDENGFNIEILDSGGSPVGGRSFDYVAKGYGKRIEE